MPLAFFGADITMENYAARVRAELDPLLFYESQTVGKEFVPFIPSGHERRLNEARRDELLVKNWRGVPTERGESSSGGCKKMNNMRNIEAKQIIDSERLFLFVLAAMTILLGTMFAYFVMNFVF